MIYNNLERIYETSHIENKYALAMVVSTRARQLSEQKGRGLDGEGSERFISHAIDEIEEGRLIIGPGALANAQNASAAGAR
jgi:DNA-directed RNA polymerase omega subunit